MHLSDQEIVRRENLQKIRDLGFDPYPADRFDVNVKSTDFTTAALRANMVKALATIKGIGEEKAKAAVEILANNRFKAQALLDAEELGLSETVEFDAAANRSPMALEEFVNDLRESALGEFQKEQRGEVAIAGRFMGQRGPFAQLQDNYGRVQLYLRKGELGESEEEKENYNQLLKLLDIGDYIGVKGFFFSTGTGELTLHVTDLYFLSKALRPLPIVKRDKEGNIHDAFTDPELRYRQRYVDLTVNPEKKAIFTKRSRIISAMRRFFDDQGWLEVETPVLQPIHGGAAARPFATHHNTLDMPLYMRIANELYLKRLIVGGYDGVYEIGKMFRNEGMDRTHNPEFTSMEIYVAYKDYNWMMEMVEQCLEYITREVNGGDTKVPVGKHIVDFAGPYRRLSMYDSIKEYTGVDISEMDEAQLRDLCKELHVDVDPSMGRGKLIDEIFG